MNPTFFETAGAFRRWLKQHHKTEGELWVGFHKKGSGLPSMTWPESVDEALCFGWIDGIRKSIDKDRYMIRFTPRNAGSIWSAVNTKKAQALIDSGRMKPAGLRAFEARDPRKSGLYSFEQRKQVTLSAEAEQRFRDDKAAWSFFQSQPPGYRRTAVFWVMSAKQESTRARRLDLLIADSRNGKRIGLLRRPGA
jgi:uncharacterized protein YdeI (YjbR/CyaY-like superfamily)